MQVRKLIKVPWQGRDYECIPGPALISSVESRPEGQPMRIVIQSLRITDHAWVIYCALFPHVPGLVKDEVIDAVMKEPNVYEALSLDLCAETLYPESARIIGKQNESGEPNKLGNVP